MRRIPQPHLGKFKMGRTIQQKVRLMSVTLVAFAIALTSLCALLGMSGIRKRSASALLSMMIHTLRGQVQNLAELTQDSVGTYGTYAEYGASVITELYSKAYEWNPRNTLPPDPADAGRFTMQRYLADPSIKISDVATEMGLLANIETFWEPIAKEEQDIITELYLGTESGVMLGYNREADLGAKDMTGPDAYFEYRNTDWYLNAKRAGHTVYSNVYQDSYGRGLVITCSTPFYSGNEFKGVTCVDLRISDLQKAVREADFGKGTEAFLVDGLGQMIASPDVDLSKQTFDSIWDKNSPLYEASGWLMERAATDADISENDLFLAPSGIYYVRASVPLTGWTYVVRVPGELVTAPVLAMSRNVFRWAGTFLFAILIIYLIAARFADRLSHELTAPLKQLKREAAEISGGNLDLHAEIHSDDEIGDLADSFNQMTDSLKRYIENLTVVTAERERIGAELDIATRIQADMVPHTFPPFPDRKEFDIYASMTPAKEVGGDFYDFFMVDQDHLGLVIADVSGKGVPAALFMMVSMLLLHTRSKVGGSPAEILYDVNNSLCERNMESMFVTVWLGILEYRTGRLVAANAGHEYPVLKQAGGSYAILKDRHGPALGAMENMSFKDYELRLSPGDTLFLYTDGVPEATDSGLKMYGDGRMLEALDGCGSDAPDRILSAVHRSVNSFVGEAPQFDDLTMLALTWRGEAMDG